MNHILLYNKTKGIKLIHQSRLLQPKLNNIKLHKRLMSQHQKHNINKKQQLKTKINIKQILKPTTQLYKNLQIELLNSKMFYMSLKIIILLLTHEKHSYKYVLIFENYIIVLIIYELFQKSFRIWWRGLEKNCIKH